MVRLAKKRRRIVRFVRNRNVVIDEKLIGDHILDEDGDHLVFENGDRIKNEEAD